MRSLGHSVGCHGLNHTEEEDLRRLESKQEFALLREATLILEDALGEPINAFRSPCYRISNRTLPILEELGYKVDLSVSPQHFPLFSSSLWSCGRMFSPRSPYHPSESSPYRRGSLKLLEIPTSCLLIPFAQASILSLPRMATGIMTKLLISEARRLGRVVVLQFHPESVVGKDDWKYPPLVWKDFLPIQSGGIGLRYRLIERDPVKVRELTDSLLLRLRVTPELQPLSVDEFLAGVPGAGELAGKDEVNLGSDEVSCSRSQVGRAAQSLP